MLFISFFLLLTYFILVHSEISLFYAFNGFTLWYAKMVPALLPFMIISGLLIYLDLAHKFAGIFHPIFHKIYGCSSHVSYGILMGFLCGFPMGAKVAADLYREGKITVTEAEFLLCFTNNIGPVYFCSFIIPLLHLNQVLPYLFGMYGIPLIYGFLLRNTYYRDKLSANSSDNIPHTQPAKDIFTALNLSINDSVQKILMLCGYMIFFNLLNILPHFIIPSFHKYISPLLEITGGLNLLNGDFPYLCLCYLMFGGLSCIAQTHSMISNTDLSIRKYMLHKCVITVFSAVYYLFLFFLD